VIELSPDSAMEILNSFKLKLIVYILITAVYNFNSMFVAAIPFLTEDPKFLCQRDDGSYFQCKKDLAC
jgi:hypothetical protein